MFKAKLFLVALLAFAMVAGISTIVENSKYISDDELNDEVRHFYGEKLEDFYFVGEEGFQARWLTEQEDAKSPCQLNKHCVFIKVATIADCEFGSIVEFRVTNQDEETIEQTKSPVFLLEPGNFINVELGSPKLSEKGFVEPLDAYCSEMKPYV